jgi:hypothetical protein
VIATDRRLDQARTILFSAVGQRETDEARVRKVGRVSRGANRPGLIGAVTGNGLAHHRAQFLFIH